MTEKKTTRDEALEAVRTLIRWAGDDPNRNGLLDTPRRVVDAYLDHFSGYKEDPIKHLHVTFEEINDYDEIIVLRDIRFESHCEHHMSLIIGHAHIAYLPNKCVVGISKLARIVDVYAKRLQLQERMTTQIAKAIHSILKPRGVAVILEASHQCLTCRGARKPGSLMITSCLLGVFRDTNLTRQEVLTLLKPRPGEIF